MIAENAPDAIKTGDIKQQFGRKVAIVSSSFQITLQAGGQEANNYRY